MFISRTPLCVAFMVAIIFSGYQANASTQRLMVPRIERTVAAINGEFSLPAFCTDMGRKWPDGTLKYVLWGADQTTMRIKVNGKTQVNTLGLALQKKWVSVHSAAQSIIIRRINPAVKLTSITPAGFLLGQAKEAAPISMEVFLSEMPALVTTLENAPNYIYYRYQQDWWRAVYAAEKITPSSLVKRMREIAQARFGNKKGLEVSVADDGRITLIDKGKNLKTLADFYTTEHVSLYQLERLNIEAYEDLEVCLHFNPHDSSLFSLTISGKLQNVMPFELEYTSSNELTVFTGVDKKIDLAKGVELESSIGIFVDPQTHKASTDYPFKECGVKFGGAICLPAAVSIDIEVCGISVSMKPTSFHFATY